MQEATTKITNLLVENIINPLVILGFMVATLYFLYGVAVFVLQGKDVEKRKTGTQHMLWGIVGLSIMFCAFGILQFVGNSGDELLNTNTASQGLKNLQK